MKYLLSLIIVLIAAMWIGLGVWAGEFETIEPGNCFTYEPTGSPFKADEPIHKCVIAVRDGWVQYYFITKYAGRWRCDVSSDSDSWFRGPALMKTEHRAGEFCASLRNVEEKSNAKTDQHSSTD